MPFVDILLPPPDSALGIKHYAFVIVGASTTAYAAIEAILQHEPTADILVLSDDVHLPRVDHKHDSEDSDTSPSSDGDEAASRLIMSNTLFDTFNEWRRSITPWLEVDVATPPNVVTLATGKHPVRVDVEAKLIALDDGSMIAFDKCLIATAGKPRPLYVLDSSRLSYALDDCINTTASRSDFEALHRLSPAIKSVSIIGGGFLATELAVALAAAQPNRQVELLFVTMPGPCAHELPSYLSVELKRRLESLGNAHVKPGTLVTSVKTNSNVDRRSSNDSPRHRLCLLAPTHIDPTVHGVVAASLEVDPQNGGIVVNAQLDALADIFVAGSAASYFDEFVGRRRVDRYDHAVNSGLLAGYNIAAPTGTKKVYRHQPMFRSNMNWTGVTCEGVGVIDASLRTVGVWLRPSRSSAKPYERGIVYYLRGNKIVGMLLRNAEDMLEKAKIVMATKPTVASVADVPKVISLGPDEWLHIETTEGLQIHAHQN
ncbi:hypothetical protein H310_08104 [Aphanomyces invadans]|uniref:FAD/NAD(P)-binding domain-containing protein n=1 Tax=Aphanomyces invadans TaxID=157072 RepID=A0A024TZ41_9STRA|nr:hypothetical protein H310_08104 [Aphanomyces invadans]ETV99400.1 hypothetical protein H310_08104 [Aphanomyces invadans]|eukprot:XP_008871956.1 hypothetical protein H310_08104 [Aphanomyces invadans]